MCRQFTVDNFWIRSDGVEEENVPMDIIFDEYAGDDGDLISWPIETSECVVNCCSRCYYPILREGRIIETLFVDGLAVGIVGGIFHLLTEDYGGSMDDVSLQPWRRAIFCFNCRERLSFEDNCVVEAVTGYETDREVAILDVGKIIFGESLLMSILYEIENSRR